MGFVRNERKAQPLLTAAETVGLNKDVQEHGAAALTESQFYFLHAAWVKRQELLNPEPK